MTTSRRSAPIRRSGATRPSTSRRRWAEHGSPAATIICASFGAARASRPPMLAGGVVMVVCCSICMPRQDPAAHPRVRCRRTSDTQHSTCAPHRMRASCAPHAALFRSARFGASTQRRFGERHPAPFMFEHSIDIAFLHVSLWITSRQTTHRVHDCSCANPRPARPRRAARVSRTHPAARVFWQFGKHVCRSVQ